MKLGEGNGENEGKKGEQKPGDTKSRKTWKLGNYRAQQNGGVHTQNMQKM
jgi:hypothetical protein